MTTPGRYIVRPLTVREKEVAALIAASRTTKQIAAYLGIDERRVRKIISTISEKIKVDPASDTRVAIALWWHAAA